MEINHVLDFENKSKFREETRTRLAKPFFIN